MIEYSKSIKFILESAVVNEIYYQSQLELHNKSPALSLRANGVE